MPFRCETTALVILRPQAVRPQLLSRNAVLLYEVLDHLLLVAIYPSGEGHEQKLSSWQVRNHPPSLPPAGSRPVDELRR